MCYQLTFVLLQLFCMTSLVYGQSQKKTKDYSVAVSIDPSFYIPYEGKYINNTASIKYHEAFCEEFEDHLNYKNIQIKKRFDSTLTFGKDFFISLESVTLHEALRTETVTDPVGYTKDLSYLSCSVEVKFKIMYLPNAIEFKTTKVEVTRDEKVTNKRTFFDVLFKVPQEEVGYRVRELSDEVFLTMCKRSARKTANKSIRIIEREIKRIKNGK